jgi:TolA-binding protein
VESIQLAGKDAFNRAEKLQADPNTAGAAVAAYDEASSALKGGWQEKLLRLRRLGAADSAGLIDRATQDWLAAMDDSPTAGVEALRPKVGAKVTGSAGAIASLETKLKTVKDASYQAAIKGLLLRLYEREGLKDKIAAMAGQLAAPGAAVSNRDQLRALAAKIDAGQVSEALKDILDHLDQYDDSDLPRGLLLAGKAQMKLAEAAPDAPGKKKQYVTAGLSLMRVYAYYPKSPDAAEALYLAGQANESLPAPNHAAARAAFEKVISEYSSSPFAASAKTALDKIRK